MAPGGNRDALKPRGEGEAAGNERREGGDAEGRATVQILISIRLRSLAQARIQSRSKLREAKLVAGVLRHQGQHSLRGQEDLAQFTENSPEANARHRKQRW